MMITTKAERRGRGNGADIDSDTDTGREIPDDALLYGFPAGAGEGAGGNEEGAGAVGGGAW